ncbi:MAG: DUF835 domain-containing protein [Thermodesulfobacteriota bacterium]|nr:DUF835 domain-containing protein [Thermodesulfobacteriota bacterium]
MSIWAFSSLLPGILHFVVGGYVLYQRPRQPLNVVFSLFAFSLFIWCITEFVHRLDITPHNAYLWMMFGGPGWSFSPALYLHFALLFAHRKRVLQTRLVYALLYGPPVLLLSLFYGTDLIYHHAPVAMYFGYTLLPGQYAWLCIFYYLVVYVMGAYFLLDIARKGGGIEKRQARVVLSGVGLSLFFAMLTNMILPVLHMPVPELATLFTAPAMIAVFYAILKYQLFIISPSMETPHPTPPKYFLERGCSLMLDEGEDKAYSIFFDQVTHGAQGLCITKFPPEKVRKKYNIAKSPLIWLTFKDGVNTVSPREFNRLETAVTEFLLKAQDACILVDCFREMELVNGFEKAAGMIRKIDERCQAAGARLIISLIPLNETEDRKEQVRKAIGR